MEPFKLPVMFGFIDKLLGKTDQRPARTLALYGPRNDSLDLLAGLDWILKWAEELKLPEADWVTYTRENPATGQIYSGRSGGYGKPLEIAYRRAARQPLLNAEGFALPVVDAVSTNISAIRGREQQLIDYFGGAQSVGGSTRNRINGVADFNPFRDFYIQQSIQQFGPLPDNSPNRPRFGTVTSPGTLP